MYCTHLPRLTTCILRCTSSSSTALNRENSRSVLAAEMILRTWVEATVEAAPEAGEDSLICTGFVQLSFTLEIEALCMLFERSISVFWVTSPELIG